VNRKGLAPSERHLEDYLFSHPEALGMCGVPPQYGPDSPMYTMHDRQVAVPSGIIDIVASNWQLVIMELKKGQVTARTFTQLMRYMRDIYGLVETAVDDYIRTKGPFYEKLKGRWNGSEYAIRDLVAGVLIGNGYEDDNLLVACASCNVDVFIYTYKDGAYQFEQLETAPYYRDKPPYWNMLHRPIGTAIRDILYENVAPPPTKEHTQFDAVTSAEKHLDKTSGDV
jgi:hypothetical protein